MSSSARVVQAPPVAQAHPDAQHPWKESKRTPITTAHVPLVKMPKKHFVHIIEHIEPRLDPTIVGPMDQTSVVMLCWLLTRIKCNTLIQDFHVSFYD